jgi:putative membrane protein
MKFVARWLAIFLGLMVAAWLVPGIQVREGSCGAYAVMALVLSLLNATLLPLLKVASCGMIILTLGLFSLVLNAAVFMLASSITVNWFNFDFHVENFWAALLGSIIVSIINTLVSRALVED